MNNEDKIIQKLKEKAMEIKYFKHNPDQDCECKDCRIANTILEILNNEETLEDKN